MGLGGHTPQPSTARAVRHRRTPTPAFESAWLAPALEPAGCRSASARRRLYGEVPARFMRIPALPIAFERADAISLASAHARALGAKEPRPYLVPPVGYEPTLGPF